MKNVFIYIFGTVLFISFCFGNDLINRGVDLGSSIIFGIMFGLLGCLIYDLKNE